jgi:hypothetical protein
MLRSSLKLDFPDASSGDTVRSHLLLLSRRFYVVKSFP